MQKTESAVPRDLQHAPTSLFSIIPLVPSAQTSAQTRPYKPEFFNESEWTLLSAACKRLSATTPVDTNDSLQDLLAFIDQHMLSPYAHGDLGCVQDPFFDTNTPHQAATHQSLRDQVRTGIAALDQYCQHTYQHSFSELSDEQQQQVLDSAEAGHVGKPAQDFIGLLRTEIEHSRFAHPLFTAYEPLTA
ncbi:gluconate 2-dehydrogenase gamma chain [Pseudomonas duriflava]|uniref:Gluconate 2-dehydrogenase gamma chain n=1 Tax=Pseudomonas duriflava TaxID=459528 RepID=A0A562Q8C0_9PSED|nr:gluconate 2-dehydrogenase subunit 3 family protein [Pseudomonas duriflava]TWI53011.1 gluconate 2-dehydrogenase gamma chain [Pseudomonas duriflava]